uniref:Uncharacterized protein n=1 Tax=Anguilla anguilla TaxID=7936 RepID=A0A0E9RP64_ANGAN
MEISQGSLCGRETRCLQWETWHREGLRHGDQSKYLISQKLFFVLHLLYNLQFCHLADAVSQSNSQRCINTLCVR